MDFKIGMGLFALCAGLVGYGTLTQDFEFTNAYYMKIAAAGLGGTFVTASSKWASIKKLFNKDGVEKTVEEYLLQDFEALTYMKKRSVDMGSSRAFELIAELNDLFFKNGAPVQQEVAVVMETEKQINALNSKRTSKV